MRKINSILFLIMTLVLFGCSGDLQDNDNMINETNNLFEKLEEDLDRLNMLVTEEHFSYFKLPSLGFNYTETMTPIEMQTALIDDYNESKDDVLYEALGRVESKLFTLDIDLDNLVEGIPYSETVNNDQFLVDYTLVYYNGQDTYGFELYTKSTYINDSTTYTLEGLLVEITDVEGQLVMDYVYNRIEYYQTIMNMYEATGRVKENETKHETMHIVSLVDDVIQSESINQSFLDLQENTHFSKYTNLLNENTSYHYYSSNENYYVDVDIIGDDIEDYVIDFYVDYFPEVTVKYSTWGFNKIEYNLAYVDGWDSYIFDGSAKIYNNDIELLQYETHTLLSLVGGYIKIHKYVNEIDPNDLDIGVEGLTMTDFDFDYAKSILNSLNKEFFTDFELEYFTLDIEANVNLELDSPYE